MLTRRLGVLWRSWVGTERGGPAGFNFESYAEVLFENGIWLGSESSQMLFP
jgi:hypothetical protein